MLYFHVWYFYWFWHIKYNGDDDEGDDNDDDDDNDDGGCGDDDELVLYPRAGFGLHPPGKIWVRWFIFAFLALTDS